MHVLCMTISMQLLYIRQLFSQYKTIVLALLISGFFKELSGQNFQQI